MFEEADWNTGGDETWGDKVDPSSCNKILVSDKSSPTNSSVDDKASGKRKPSKRNKYRKNENTPKVAIIENSKGLFIESNALIRSSEPIKNVQLKTQKTTNKGAEKSVTENNVKKEQVTVLGGEQSNENIKTKRTRRRKRKHGKSNNNVEMSKINNDLSDQTMLKKAKITEDNEANDDTVGGINTDGIVISEDTRSSTLRQKMLAQLSGGQFRFLNEQLYSIRGSDAFKMFKNDRNSYELYHEGYRNQVLKWPINPIDVIISQVQKMPAKHVIADFGCGDAKLAQTFPQRKIHSFDLVATNSYVTACDMSKVPLKDGAANAVVFCLSLMGSNLGDYLREANRVLNNNGILKIAELESRFDDVLVFTNSLKHYGFTLIKKEELNEYFLLFDLKKKSEIGLNKKKLPNITLKPCLYKRR